MIVRMFKPQFAPMVESRTKLQTVRPRPKRMPKVGEVFSGRCWTGKPYRSKQRTLVESVVTQVQRIEIAAEGWIWIDDFRIKNRNDFETFARADGFDTPELMLEWFSTTHDLPFEGIVIHWQ